RLCPGGLQADRLVRPAPPGRDAAGDRPPRAGGRLRRRAALARRRDGREGVMAAPIQTNAPLAQGSNSDHSRAMATTTVCTIVLFMFPGALLGGAIAYLLWRLTRPDIVTRWLVAGLSAATAAALQPAVAFGWTWRFLVQLFVPSAAPASLDSILGTVPAEMLLGPMLLVW